MQKCKKTNTNYVKYALYAYIYPFTFARIKNDRKPKDILYSPLDFVI